MISSPIYSQQPSAAVPDAAKYWANYTPDKLAQEAYKKFEGHFRNLETGGLARIIERAYMRYYGRNHIGKSSTMTPSGERGELTTLYVNELRNLCTHLLTLVTGMRLAYKASPINSSLQAREASMVGDDLLAGARHSKHLDEMLHLAAEMALITTEGHVRVDWDYTLGEPYTVAEDGRILMDGDCRVGVFSIWNVAVERKIRQPGEKPRWVVIREHVNKYDLAAQYPEHAEKILAQQPSNKQFKIRYPGFSRDFFGYGMQTTDEDLIPIYSLYHAKTAATPAGRELMFFGEGEPLIDGPLSYDTIPVYSISPSRVMDSGYNYTPVFDVLGPLDAMNSLMSATLTNGVTFGVQNITAPKGSGITSTKLANGLNLLLYDIGAPTPLAPVQSPPELFTGIEMYKNIAGMHLGIGPITRGEIPEKLSGSAMALADSKSLQFANFFQMQYKFLGEHVGKGIMDVYAARATSPRLVTMLGPDKAYMLRSFQGSDLEGVGMVTLELDNPFNQTSAGRYEKADKFLERGLVRSPEEYDEVIDTGRVEPILKGPRSENLNIIAENEQMMKGEEPQILMTDNDFLHIAEHKCVGDHPESRKNPQVMAVWAQHMMKHTIQAATKNPVLAMALGQNASVMLQQNAAAQRGAPDGQNPQQGQGAASGPNPEKSNQPDMPSMPDMPKHPG